MAHVLVFERHQPSRQTLTRRMREAGHRVSALGSWHEALDLLRRWPFDIVIADLELENGDAGAVVLVARRFQPRATIVVATDCAGSDAATGRLLACGACIVAARPLNQAALLQVLAEWRAKGRRSGAFVLAASARRSTPNWPSITLRAR